MMYSTLFRKRVRIITGNMRTVLIVLSIVATLIAAAVVQNKQFFKPGASENYVSFKSSSFESGNFSEWDQTNASEGTLDVVDATSPTGQIDGAKITRAYQSGNTSNNGHFSRTIWNLPSWHEGVRYKTEAFFYLPVGFTNSITDRSSVQLIGWDTYPTLNNQTRVIIWSSDRKARLFMKSDGNDTVLTNNFDLPEGRWFKLTVEQNLSNDPAKGWSKVYLDDQLVGQGQGDNLTPYPITRYRYGLVAIADNIQNQPLTVYFDKVSLDQYSQSSSSTAPTPTSASLTISDVSASATNITSVISWKTNLPANSYVYYGGSRDEFSMNRYDLNLVTNHSLILTDLSPGTHYYYQVRSKTENGTEVVSSVNSFRTRKK